MHEHPFELTGIEVTPAIPDAPLIAEDLLAQAQQWIADGADPDDVADLIDLADRLLEQ